MKKIFFAIVMMAGFIRLLTTTSVTEAGKKPTPTPTEAPKASPTPEACLDGIFAAVDPETGVCYEYTSSCNIPATFTRVSSCQ